MPRGFLLAFLLTCASSASLKAAVSAHLGTAHRRPPADLTALSSGPADDVPQFGLLPDIIASTLLQNASAVSPSEVVGVAFNRKNGDLAALRFTMGVSCIGSMLALLCFSILRRQNPIAYQRQRLPEEEVAADSVVELPVVGLFDWLSLVLKTTPEEEIAAAGLDGWSLLEFHRMHRRIFMSILPFAFLVSMLHWYDSRNIEDLDLLGRLDTAVYGSQLMETGYPAMVWIVVLVTSWQMVTAHERFIERRFEWLKSLPLPRATTVLVRNIPEEYRSDQALKDYFGNLFREASAGTNAVESAYIVRKTGSLPYLVEELEQANYTLALAKRTWEKQGCPGPDESSCSYLAACQQRRQKLANHVADAQGKIERAVEYRDRAVCSSCGFVTFKTELAQRLASREQYRRDVTEFALDAPPDPADVVYKNLAEDELGSTTWAFVGWFCYLAIFLFWVPVVVVISSWTNLATLEQAAPFIRELLEQHPQYVSAVTGVLSTAALKLFLGFLPWMLFAVIERFGNLKANALAQLRLQSWYAMFLIIFVLLVTTLGRGLTTTVASILKDPSSLAKTLSSNLPATSHFYFNYVVLCWFTLVVELLRVTNLLKWLFFRHACGFTADVAKAYCEPEDQTSYGMGSRTALAVLMSAITFSFCTTSPLILPLAVVYFILADVVYGYLLIFAESKKPDLGGEFWMQAVQQVLMILLLYVIIMSSVLLAKYPDSWLPAATAAAALLVLYGAWRRVNNLAFESLPLEELVKASRAKQAEKKQRIIGQYVQPELKPEVLNE